MSEDMHLTARNLISQHAADDSALEWMAAAEHVKNEIADTLEREQFNAAVRAVAEGASLSAVGQRLGLSRWAVAKRWPNLTKQAKIRRWWCRNALTWVDALDDLVSTERHSAMDTFLPEESQAAIESLTTIAAHYRQSGSWTLLPATRGHVDTLLAHAPSEDAEHQKARDWISALMSDCDQTCAERKGPELAVTREAIAAATQDRINRAAKPLGSPNGKGR